MADDLRKQFNLVKKQLFDKLYSRLNEKQREAVYSVNGPLLVLAGAGSGKTTVLVNRIAHILSFGNLYGDDGAVNVDVELLAKAKSLLENGTATEIRAFLSVLAEDKPQPYELLCITFTNKAANEFKARLENILGENSKELWSGTFHSVCVRILRRHIELLGYNSDFTIYDTDDTKRIITDIYKELDLSEDALAPRTASNEISRAKESSMLPDEYEIYAGNDSRLNTVAKIYRRYQHSLKMANALDFDDIILLTLKLFDEYPEVLDKYRNRFKYISVDEYQDTNLTQNRLVLMLASKHCNVCVVGDDDQSIYSFRGATVENILSFDKAFRNCRTIRLEQNYRSTQNILSAANAIIGNNTLRKGKNLWTDKGAGERILLKKQYTQSEEAGYIVSYIREQVMHNNAKYSDFAVLYRLNALSNALEIIFSKSRIPYRVFGGTRFYERKEIKDILAYLAVINNPSDNVRIKRILNVPKRGIGNTTSVAIYDLAEREGKSVYDVIKDAAFYPEIQKSASKLDGFCSLMAELRELSQTITPSELIKSVIERTKYRDMVLASDEPERAENLDELVSAAMMFEENAEDASLAAFLADIALVTDVDNYDTDANAVTLMTVHSSKGLEFPTVFLPAFEDGIFPSTQAIMSGSTAALEEERRLAYVAVTRAKEHLVISHTGTRLLYGQTTQNPLSRFVEEIPKNLVTIEQSVKTVYNNVSEAKRKYVSSQQSFIKNVTKAPAESKPAVEQFEVGARVDHFSFGKGTVKKLTPMGGDVLYEIEFDRADVGVKKLMGSFAKLRRS